ncbi:hypothetical protein V8C34DRAFT_180943 [Trichoderma compactum]
MAGQIDSRSMCLLLDRALPVSSLSTVVFDNQQSDQAIFITIAVNSANDISGESRFLLGHRSASCPVHSWATCGDEHGRCLMPKLKLALFLAPRHWNFLNRDTTQPQLGNSLYTLRGRSLASEKIDNVPLKKMGMTALLGRASGHLVNIDYFLGQQSLDEGGAYDALECNRGSYSGFYCIVLRSGCFRANSLSVVITTKLTVWHSTECHRNTSCGQ